MSLDQVILSIRRLTVDFPSGEGRFTAVNDVSFNVRAGEVLALVGESGSGKTVTALSILGLLDEHTGASIDGSVTLYNGEGATELVGASNEVLRTVRGKRIAMVFQESMSSLNPALTCGEQIAEAVRLHHKLKGSEVAAKVFQVLEEAGAGNPQEIARKYPGQISGGQKQRVLIAMALACDPDILIADEPTSSLDASVRRKVLESIKSARRLRNLTMIFITHDLDIVLDIADRILVMYAGKVVEQGAMQDVFSNPRHPYTNGLINCRPPKSGRYYFLPTIEDFMRVSADGKQMQELTDVGTLFKKLEITPAQRSTRHKKIYGQPSIMKVENLSKQYHRKTETWIDTSKPRVGIRDVSFELYPGETLGLVGESGCGKTTLARCLLGLDEADHGSVQFRRKNRREYHSIHSLVEMGRQVQYIFQDTFSSLDPKMTIGETLMEPLLTHRTEWTPAQRKDRVVELLTQVGLKPHHYNRYPLEFSGGQRQRISIARALLLDPSVIICDEPVSSLDVSVQAQVLNLLNELKYEYNLSYLFISHDMNVVRFMSDRLLVMQGGSIIEQGEADEVFYNPKEAATKLLVS